METQAQPAINTFAAEVKAARHQAKAPEVKAAAEGRAIDPQAAPKTVAAPEAKTVADLSIPDRLELTFDLPSGDAPINPAAKVEAKPVPAIEKPQAKVEPEVAPPKKAPIKIGNKEFDNVEEAIEFAKELERARAEDQAYIEGVKDASKKSPEADPEVTLTPEEQFEQLVFSDPKKAAQQLRESIKQEIYNEYNQTVRQSTEMQAKQAAEKNAWETFYKENPDLSDPDTRDMVQNYLVKKHWDDIKDLDAKKGFTKLAETARKTLKISKEAALPTTEMPSGPVTTTGASQGEPTAPTTEKNNANLDFVSQLNNFRKGIK